MNIFRIYGVKYLFLLLLIIMLVLIIGGQLIINSIIDGVKNESINKDYIIANNLYVTTQAFTNNFKPCYDSNIAFRNFNLRGYNSPQLCCVTSPF